MNVIFHINERNKWETTFNSAFNMYAAAAAKGQAAEIYIVANGEAVEIMTAQEGPLAKQRSRLHEAFPKKIQVCFCKKAMDLRSLTLPEDLNQAEVVPSAAYFIVELQEKGFAYIKS